MPNVNGYEYRVRWLREGGKVKTRIFQNLWTARRLVVFMGPEPWKAFGKRENDLLCCNGYECGCQGATVGDDMLSRRKGENGIPPPMFAEIQRRKVGEWEAVPAPRGEAGGEVGR